MCNRVQGGSSLRTRLLLILWLTLAALPATAHAQGILTAFVGTTMNTKLAGESFAEKQFTWGFSAGSINTVGFEVDFGMTDNFIGNTDILDTRLVTLMGNVLITVPMDRGGPGIRPYATGGIGLIKLNVKDLLQIVSVSKSDLGMNVGFGAIGFLSGSFGIRGDLRYFRTLSGNDDELFDLILGDVSFWRASVGASLRF